MTRAVVVLTLAVVAMLVVAAAAPAKTTKFTFSDVTYPDGTTGEIEASVKNTNKLAPHVLRLLQRRLRGVARLLPGPQRDAGLDGSRGGQGVLPRALRRAVPLVARLRGPIGRALPA